MSSHFRRSNRGEGGKQGGGTNGVGDSVSEANRYVSEGSKCPAGRGTSVSEANRYVGDARKRPAGARIWARRALKF